MPTEDRRVGAIWKYPIAHGRNVLTMPAGAEPLTVGPDPSGQLCLWAAVSLKAPQVQHRFEVVDTGEHLAEGPMATAARFVGTVTYAFDLHIEVWHVLDFGELPLEPGGAGPVAEEVRTDG